jgi:hypothetical protein
MSDEHNPEAYRLLFALIGVAMFAMVGVFILASSLVAPWWVVATLGALWIGGAVTAVRTWQERMWTPIAIGTVLAVIWIALLTLGTTRSGS